MIIHSGQCVVLEDDGAVAVYDGVDYLQDIENAPRDLRVENGSFRRFVEVLAKECGLSIKTMEWSHCFGLELE